MYLCENPELVLLVWDALKACGGFACGGVWCGCVAESVALGWFGLGMRLVVARNWFLSGFNVVLIESTTLCLLKLELKTIPRNNKHLGGLQLTSMITGGPSLV